MSSCPWLLKWLAHCEPPGQWQVCAKTPNLLSHNQLLYHTASHDSDWFPPVDWQCWLEIALQIPALVKCVLRVLQIWQVLGIWPVLPRFSAISIWGSVTITLYRELHNIQFISHGGTVLGFSDEFTGMLLSWETLGVNVLGYLSL